MKAFLLWVRDVSIVVVIVAALWAAFILYQGSLYLGPNGY